MEINIKATKESVEAVVKHNGKEYTAEIVPTKFGMHYLTDELGQQVFNDTKDSEIATLLDYIDLHDILNACIKAERK